MILIAEMVVFMRSGALEYIRNRKTVQMIIQKLKDRNKFQSKLKTGSQIREDVRVVEIVKGHSFRR